MSDFLEQLDKIDHRSSIEKYLVPVTKEPSNGHNCIGCFAQTDEFFRVQFKQVGIYLCPTCYIGLKNGIRDQLKTQFNPIPQLDCQEKTNDQSVSG